MATGTHVYNQHRHDGPIVVDAMGHTFTASLLCANAGCTVTYDSHQTSQNRCSGVRGKFTGEIPSEPGPDRDRAFYRLWARYDGDASVSELAKRLKLPRSTAQKMLVRGQALEMGEGERDG